MGGSGSKPISLPDFLKDPKKEPIANAASEMAQKLTAAAIHALVTQVGGVVAGAIGEAIVQGFWNEIFPPVDVAPAIDEIRNEVKEALTEDTITQINGRLKALQDRLRINYASEKEKGNLENKAERQQLWDILHQLDSSLGGVIGTLMQDGYAEIGLLSFMLLAGFRLGIYQEMANVDPENVRFDPLYNHDPAKSRYATPYTGVIAQYAKEYADHAEEYWNKAIVDRQTMIKVTPWSDGGGRIDDKATGTFAQTSNESIDTFAATYWAKQKKIFENKFANPEEVIANWRKLIKVPINTNVMKYTGAIELAVPAKQKR